MDFGHTKQIQKVFEKEKRALVNQLTNHASNVIRFNLRKSFAYDTKRYFSANSQELARVFLFNHRGLESLIL